MSSFTTAELKNVVALSELPEEHLQWIADHSTYHEFEDGALVRKFGDPVNEMNFLLEGGISFYMNVNGREVHYANFANDTATGGVSGLLPYSRMKSSPGNAYAVGKIRAVYLDKQYF